MLVNPNVYMCVQGRERAKKLVIMCLITKWMNSNSFSERHTRTESLILKIRNIVGIYASKFFSRTLFTNDNVYERQNAKVCPVFQRIYFENWPSLSLFNIGNMIRLHYGTHIAYSHIFSSCFQRIFIVFFLSISCKQT